MDTKVKVVIVSAVVLILLVLSLGLGLGLGLWHASESQKSQDCPPISLDMAPTSVDDMYDKCEEKMKEKIEKDFLQNEKNKNKSFKEAWNKAEEYYKKEWEKNPPLMKEQIMAIHAEGTGFPLDMAVNSVDDRYSTCAAKMEAKVKKTYFEKEMKNNVFSKAWNAAENCAEKNMKQKEPVDKALTKDHMQAICVYTAGGPADFYKTFNNAVRTDKQQYNSSFPFHSLHFWLTRAIQILKPNHNECYTTFRKTTDIFTGKVNQEMRFGIFASSSKLSTLTKFGETTCFQIRTCHGAYLKNYTTLGDREQEVLIPPYETFKIINKTKPLELDDCKTVYVLEHTGVQSNLDCQVANQIIL